MQGRYSGLCVYCADDGATVSYATARLYDQNARACYNLWECRGVSWILDKFPELQTEDVAIEGDSELCFEILRFRMAHGCEGGEATGWKRAFPDCLEASTQRQLATEITDDGGRQVRRRAHSQLDSERRTRHSTPKPG